MLPDLLRTKNEVKLFYLLAIIFIFALLLIEYFAAPKPDGFSFRAWVLKELASLNLTFIGAAITGLVLISFTLFLRSAQQIDKVEAIDASTFNLMHKDALSSSSQWIHDGHYGQWVRSAVLPDFADNKVDRDTKVKFFIINPENMVLINQYVAYKNSERSRFIDGEWDREEVIAQLIATIYSAQWYHALPNRLTVDVFLKDFYSNFRVDMNDEWCAQSRIDPREPAIVGGKQESWYRAYVSELNDLEKRTKKVKFRAQAEYSPPAKSSKRDIEEVINNIGVFSLDSDSKKEYILKRALQIWQSTPNRYS